MNPTTAHSIDTSPDPAASPDLAKSSDRREHARSIKVMRIARLKNIQMHAECLGMVRDVSSGGMKIDALVPLEVGHRLRQYLISALTYDVRLQFPSARHFRYSSCQKNAEVIRTGLLSNLARHKLQPNPKNARRAQVDGRIDLARHHGFVEDILHTARQCDLFGQRDLREAVQG